MTGLTLNLLFNNIKYPITVHVIKYHIPVILTLRSQVSVESLYGTNLFLLLPPDSARAEITRPRVVKDLECTYNGSIEQAEITRSRIGKFLSYRINRFN